MPCYHPLTAWYSKEKNPSGKRGLVFNPKRALQADSPIEIACGQCVGCRLERSRQWAMRCIHEASLYENNCFLTLTFSPDSLEKRDNPWSLDVRDFQLFMKRLRKKYGDGIRFFHCGEYGEKYGRPHYHAIIFNFDFPDKELFQISNGHRLYTSKSLDSLWPYGFATIGDVTFDSAAYVARYILKKVTGDEAEYHYLKINEETGECSELKPEYVTMSRRPGIGKLWYEKYKKDVYANDYVIVNGKKMKPPKYYDRQYEVDNPYEHDYIKDMRKVNGLKHSENNTPERLQVREKVQLARINKDKLPRKIDEET